MRGLRNLPIRWKITGLAFGITLFTLIITGIIYLGYMMDMKKQELSHRAMITAQLVAQMQTVQREVTAENASEILQPLAENIRVLNDVDYVVILNMDRIRLTHPIPQRLHTPFDGGDEDPAFAEHIYLSKARADNAHTVRAFVPIVDEKRNQVGVVVVGNILPTFKALISEVGNPALVIFLITSVFGIWGSWLLASHIKKQTFQMEPDELARVLVERTATFNAMHEGVVAIDDQRRVTVINEVAKKFLNVEGDIIGTKIEDAIPDTRLPEILELGKPLYQREFFIQGKPILSNRIPIKVGDKTIGALAVFQDKSEVTRLAKELTGVQVFVDTLRVQNHEYSNKIHTIAGLIQMDQGQKALDYIFQLTDEQQSLADVFSNQIHDDSIQGLILGKVSRGRELGITTNLHPETYFMNYPEGVTVHDLVVILGNLVDNSFEALTQSANETKEVTILIRETEDELLVRVEDTGDGIPYSLHDSLFTRGFSTKENEGRGIGLFLINSIVERVEGDIYIDDAKPSGAIISICLPMRQEFRMEMEKPAEGWGDQ
ncbi:sensor histidine kinase [Sporosarcina sp. 179-K 3D1 HS]|uniref:ATP-binding protein n=1 Tax=Sporosarcina sp. 179-K 3D1 HS TaxID=3232169 RepID=UPI0039A28495